MERRLRQSEAPEIERIYEKGVIKAYYYIQPSQISTPFFPEPTTKEAREFLNKWKPEAKLKTLF